MARDILALRLVSLCAGIVGIPVKLPDTDKGHALQVLLPPVALQSLELRSASEAYLAPGFDSQSLQLTTGQLGGSIAATQLAASKLSIAAAG